MRFSTSKIIWGWMLSVALCVALALAGEAKAQQGGLAVTTAHLAQVRTLLAAARSAETKGDLVAAEAGFRQAVDVAEQREPRDVPLALLWQAGFLQRHKRLGEARAAGERALALLTAVLGPDHPSTAVAHGALGSYDRDAGELASAERHFEAVLDSYRRDPREERDGEAWVAAWNLGVERHKQKRYAEAEALYRQALDIRRRYARDPPWALRLREALAMVSEQLGHMDDAVTHFEIAVEITQAAAPPGGVLADLLMRQAKLLQRLYIFDGAQTAASRAYLDRERRLGANDKGSQEALRAFESIRAQQRETTKTEAALRVRLAAEEVKADPLQTLAWLTGQLALALKDQDKLDEAEALARRSVALTEEITPLNERRYVERLQVLAAIHARQGRSAESEAGYRRAVELSPAAFGPDTPGVADAQMALAGGLEWMGKHAAAEAPYRAALVTRTKIRDPIPLSVTQVHLGALYAELGRYDEAEKLLREALAIREARLKPGDALLADVQYNLGVVFRYQHRYAQAEPYFRRALGIRKAIYGTVHHLVLGDMNALGAVLDGMGRSADAEPMLRLVLSAREELFGLESSEVATTAFTLAALLRKQGKLDEAAELAARSLTVYRKLYGANREVVAIAANTLASIHLERCDFDAAERLYREAFTIRLKAHGEKDLAMVTGYSNLSTLSAARRQFDEASGYAAKMLSIVEASLPAARGMLADHASLLIAAGELDAAEERLKQLLESSEQGAGADSLEIASLSEAMAYLYRRRGRFGDIARYYERPLAIYRAALGERHPAVARVLKELADYKVSLGEASQGLLLFDEALAIEKESFGADAPILWSTLNNTALLLAQMGETSKAEGLLERSLELLRKATTRDTADLAVVSANFAWLREQLGQREEADKLSAAALRIYRSLYGSERAPAVISAPVLPPPPKEL